MTEIIVKCFKCGYKVRQRFSPGLRSQAIRATGEAHRKNRPECHAEWRMEHTEIVAEEGSPEAQRNFRERPASRETATVWEMAASGGQGGITTRAALAHTSYTKGVISRLLDGRTAMDITPRQFAWVRNAADKEGIAEIVEETAERAVRTNNGNWAFQNFTSTYRRISLSDGKVALLTDNKLSIEDVQNAE